MIVNPQSEVRLLKDVPFDTNYRHTILFNSLVAQMNYMQSKTAFTYLKFTYLRHGETSGYQIKLPVCAENIYDCNYIMFQNAGFGTKWFFAFITDILYINNDTTAVSFVIDVWQTWLFEMEINTCYVEREHVEDDTIGKHTVEENIPFGDYVSAEVLNTESGSGVMIQLALSGSEKNVVGGIYSGLTVAGGTGDAGNVGDLIDQFADQPEKIAFLGMTSANMVSNMTVKTAESFAAIIREFNGFSFAGETYMPANNKLYCYPYNFISVDNYNGNAEIYRWEDFNAGLNVDRAIFRIHESPLPRPAMECYPQNYKGMEDAQNFGIIYDNFPMCPFVIDTYRAWASQAVPKTLISTGATIITGAISGGIEAAVGKPVSALRSIANTAVNAVSDIADYTIEEQYHSIHSSSYGGTISGSGLNFAYGRIGFRFIQYEIKPEYAKILDNYFTRFGYRVLEYKKPNLKSRASFNYIKTLESNVGGNIPQEAIDTIEQSLNNGITLWHNLNVKNYDLKNEVIAQNAVT